MAIDEIKKMTIQERIRIMEQIWDSLIAEDVIPESPQWHREILENRRKRIESGEAKFFSIPELREEDF